MVYTCEGDLCSELMAYIRAHCIVKVLDIVNSNLPWDAISANYVLPEKFPDCCRGYVGDRLRLNPFREVLDCYNCEGVVALCWGLLANYVVAPLLEGPRRGYHLRRLSWAFVWWENF
jgi:hypothetical protein